MTKQIKDAEKTHTVHTQHSIAKGMPESTLGTQKRTDNATQISHAQLWIGNHTNLVNTAKEKLQELFCPNNCKICATCKQIENEQHHGIIWIKPEKSYTREQIQIIFDTISFKLEKDAKLFFVIQHADFLSEACSNSLLKSVEEPPEGYHFIFLAERLSQILPTIQSRCIITSFYKNNDNMFGDINQIAATFKANTLCQPAEFLKLLDAEKPNEKETVEMLDSLLNHWLKKSKAALESGNTNTHKIALKKITTLKKALEQSPMPGSSKIFWRNLYLQFG